MSWATRCPSVGYRRRANREGFPLRTLAWALLIPDCMKMQHSTAKKRAGREASRRASQYEVMNMPRLYLFLELFVEKEIPGRSGK